MKKTLTMLVVLTTLLLFTQEANAKIPIIWTSGETLSTVEKLPDDFLIENRHVNLAILHDCFSLFWVPLWNYGDMQYVMSTDDEKTYYTLEPEEWEFIESEYKINMSATPNLTIWQKIAGKPIILILIAWIIWAYIPKKKEDEDLVTEPVATSENQTIDAPTETETTQTTDIEKK